VERLAPSAAGRRRGTGRKGDSRELAILDTAEELLEREGFERMTVEAIAAGAGISRGSLYFYFGSKQEVLTALVARTMASIAAAAAAATTDARLPRDEVVHRALLSTETSWREHGRVMQAAVEQGPLVPEIGRLWRTTVEDYARTMCAGLYRDAAEGLLDEALRLTQALCWMTERNYYWSYVTSGTARLSTVTRTCAQIWSSATAPS
jgi:AcrR family transcriptional regulator